MSRWHLKLRNDEVFEELRIDGKEKSKTGVLEQSSVYGGEIGKTSKKTKTKNPYTHNRMSQ